MENKCPRCGGELCCLAGRSAHPSNWYCEDEDNCGWEAWKARADLVAQREAELVAEVERLRAELIRIQKIYTPNGNLAADIDKALKAEDEG